MEEPIYVYVVSLGCSKNFVDTEVIAASLIKNGIGLTYDLDEADVCLINTCAFIPPARAEAEENIEVALDWRSEDPENRKLIISGCLTQWDKRKEYFNKYPEVDLWMGIDDLEKFPEYIGKMYSEQKFEKLNYLEKPSYLYNDKVPRLQLTPEHYAYVKIADGCNNRCAYCAIPGIRGELRSREFSSVVSEVKSLVKNGIKEILIIAQDITAYGNDLKDGSNLSELLAELDKIEGDYWLRLHYLHPEGVTEELVKVIAGAKHIIPYLDIPVQHAANSILKSMNRRISQDKLNEVMKLLRDNIPDLILRSTFLVGFPGETAEDYKILEEFIKRWEFERFGVFPFFPEKDTAAFNMDNKVDPAIAEKRADKLQALYKKMSLDFNKSLIGHSFDVIVDSEEEDCYIGRTYMDSPDIDNLVRISKKQKGIKVGEFCKVTIKGASAFELMA